MQKCAAFNKKIEQFHSFLWKVHFTFWTTRLEYYLVSFFLIPRDIGLNSINNFLDYGIVLLAGAFQL